MNTGTQTLLELFEHSLRYENVESNNESEQLVTSKKPVVTIAMYPVNKHMGNANNTNTRKIMKYTPI